jgi:hypothetical protein
MDGAIVGIFDGDEVGCKPLGRTLAEGPMDGRIDGSADGAMDGAKLVDGCSLPLGFEDGCMLTEGPSEPEGFCEGVRLGPLLGTLLGIWLGEALMPKDGMLLGTLLGDVLGVILGVRLGVALGFAVGPDGNPVRTISTFASSLSNDVKVIVRVSPDFPSKLLMVKACPEDRIAWDMDTFDS